MALLTSRWFRRRSAMLACLWAGALAAVNVRAGDVARPSNEFQIKAVFLFNFAQFAEWPAGSFADHKSPLVIGVLGTDPFGAYLDELVKDETVHGHPLVVRRYGDLRQAHDCHILYISRSETGHLPQILRDLRAQGVLTISDAEAFARMGGMVRFVTDGGKVRLRINVEAAKAAGLVISSKILRQATLVTTGRD